MRGRVFGTITAGAWIAMPFGMLLGGVLTEKLGVSTVLIGLGSHLPFNNPQHDFHSSNARDGSEEDS